jgi:aspartyl-tRNA(Asn)/glutamyl-tRNA(Gln) amidotransferase subunit C
VAASPASPAITREDVERIAGLARLELDDAEVAAMTEQLARILDYAKSLDSLPTEGVPPTAHAIPLSTPMRRDEPVPAMDPELALSNAPAREDSAFSVPRVLAGDDDG